MTASSPHVRVGLVGLGFMAATHIKAYRQVPHARVVALCSPSGSHLNGDFTGVAGNVGTNEPVKLDMTGVSAYRDFHEMLDDPSVDLVDICAPTLVHPELAIAALNAGKHVLCEKPMARTSQRVRDIVSAAQIAKGFCMPAMCMRFWPGWTWLKEVLDAKRFGKVLGARFRRVAEPPAWGQHNFLVGEKSGGALLDLHIHDTDFVQYCFGRPRRVFSTGYTKLSGAIDHVVTQYEVASGAIVHAEGSWAMTPGFGFSMSYTVNFENATADYDLARGSEALRLFEAGQPPQTISLEPTDGYVEELRHLIDSIRSGQSPSIVTAADGLAAIEICEAEEKSILSGTPVAL